MKEPTPNLDVKRKFLFYEQQAMEYFEDQKKNIVLPDSIQNSDREHILSHISSLQCSRKQARLRCQMLLRKCDILEKRCWQLKEEKELVRYFWKNKVLEGQTRGGRILMTALRSQTQ